MNFAPMVRRSPTPEQAERLRQAVAAARTVPPEKEARLRAVEGACQQTGEGIPEPALESLIEMILGIERPSHTDKLLNELFGGQPDGLFEAVGQLAAISSLMEYVALDLLSMLIDDRPREDYEAADGLTDKPNKVLDLCVERSAILSDELQEEVVSRVGHLRQLRALRHKYVHTTWSAYAGGWRYQRDSRDLIPTEAEDLSDTVDELAQVAVGVLDLVQRCQVEKSQRSHP